VAPEAIAGCRRDDDDLEARGDHRHRPVCAAAHALPGSTLRTRGIPPPAGDANPSLVGCWTTDPEPERVVVEAAVALATPLAPAPTSARGPDGRTGRDDDASTT
jgi:hypothetical protein